MVVVFAVPMLLNTVFYAAVLYTSVKQAAAISRQDAKKKRKNGRELSGRVKCLKTVGIVFAAYTACWLPHTVIVIIQYWFPHVLPHFYAQSRLYYDIVTTIISNILPPINSCINPFIYFIFSSHFRVAFKDFLFKLVKSPRHALNMYGEETCAGIRRLKPREHTTAVAV